MRTTLLRLACCTLPLLLLTATLAQQASAQRDAARPSPRTWTTRSGKYNVSATFVELNGSVVRLKKLDGSVVSVGVDNLSDADQQYIREQTGMPPKPVAEPTPAPPEAATANTGSQLGEKCEELCEQITKSYKGKGAGEKATVAVVEFSDLSGGVTNLGRFLSEELITKLFSTGNYKVIERLLLNKVIGEHKLQLQGMVDPKSAKELGKILGVDAVVSGTIADLGDSLRVNARVISTETGEVLSVAAATIGKDDTIIKLTAGTAHAAGPNAPTGAKGQPVRLPFREDFTRYKDDETTEWGKGVKVRTGADGRKWLVAATKGQHPVGQDVDLPPNAYIEFEYGAEVLEPRNRGGDKVLSGISFVDEAGAKYRIEWTISYGPLGFAAGGIWEHNLALPGGARVKELSSANEQGAVDETLRIQKTGDTITVVIGKRGETKLTGNTRDFKQFKRFEVDAYRGPNASLSFTNFRIGKLD